MSTLERQDLPPPELTPRGEEDGEPVTLWHRRNGARDIGDGGDRSLWRAHLACTLDLARALSDEAIGLGGVEDRSEGPVSVVGRRWQAPSEILIPRAD